MAFGAGQFSQLTLLLMIHFSEAVGDRKSS